MTYDEAVLAHREACRAAENAFWALDRLFMTAVPQLPVMVLDTSFPGDCFKSPEVNQARVACRATNARAEELFRQVVALRPAPAPLEDE
jgi:hypothetical protein